MKRPIQLVHKNGSNRVEAGRVSRNDRRLMRTFRLLLISLALFSMGQLSRAYGQAFTKVPATNPVTQGAKGGGKMD